MGLETLIGENFHKGTILICHLTALPDPRQPRFLSTIKDFSIPCYGVGELGSAAFDWIDFLKETGTVGWQINPYGHTGYGNSPYQTFSRFAGSPYVISIERLLEKGDITIKAHNCYTESVRNAKIKQNSVNFGWLYNNKIGHSWDDDAILRKAYERFIASGRDKKDRTLKFTKFCEENTKWLTDYAEFMGIKELHHHKPWNEWAAEFKNLERWKNLKEREKRFNDNCTLEKTINYYKYLQFVFFEQWEELRNYAKEKGRIIIGDLPWYVGFDSADVWAFREIFKLDQKIFEPLFVAGVPPDSFSDTGQLWGNPVYNWKSPETIEWWLDAIELLVSKVDIVRWDHARALDTFWEIPYEWAKTQKTATEGHWSQGPGRTLLDAVQERLYQQGILSKGRVLPFIFEDLGDLEPLYEHPDLYNANISDKKRYKVSPEFAKMIKEKDPLLSDGRQTDGCYMPRVALDKIMNDYCIPWMGVAQFGIDNPDVNDRLRPAKWPYYCIGYTGTHDNDTTLGYMISKKFNGENLHEPDILTQQLIAMTLQSKAILAGMTWQDLLELDGSARFNLPGDITKEGGWWTARISEDLMKILRTAKNQTLMYMNQMLYCRYN